MAVRPASVRSSTAQAPLRPAEGLGRQGGRWSLEPADEGVLSITDRRLVFQGSRKVQESRYDKLVGLEVFLDALRVAVTNRQTPSLYMLGDGQVAAAYVNAAAQKAL